MKKLSIDDDNDDFRDGGGGDEVRGSRGRPVVRWKDIFRVLGGEEGQL